MPFSNCGTCQICLWNIQIVICTRADSRQPLQRHLQSKLQKSGFQSWIQVDSHGLCMRHARERVVHWSNSAPCAQHQNSICWYRILLCPEQLSQSKSAFERQSGHVSCRILEDFATFPHIAVPRRTSSAQKAITIRSQKLYSSYVVVIIKERLLFTSWQPANGGLRSRWFSW